MVIRITNLMVVDLSLSKGENMNAKVQAAASAIALYLAGQTDIKVLGTAALTGFLGPVLKWLDGSSTDFGRGAE